MFESFLYSDDYEAFEGEIKIWGKNTKTYIQMSRGARFDDRNALEGCTDEIAKKLEVLEKSRGKAAKAILNGLDDLLSGELPENGGISVRSACVEVSEYGVAVDMIIAPDADSLEGIEFSVYIDEDDSVEYLGLPD